MVNTRVIVRVNAAMTQSGKQGLGRVDKIDKNSCQVTPKNSVKNVIF